MEGGGGGVKPAAGRDKEGEQSEEGLSITIAYLSGVEVGSRGRTGVGIEGARKKEE